MKNLGIEHVYQGHENKVSAFNEILQKLDLTPDQAAHIGDDLLDLPLMTRVGLSIAVADANFAVIERADWCTQLSGGGGAFTAMDSLLAKRSSSLTPNLANSSKGR